MTEPNEFTLEEARELIRAVQRSFRTHQHQADRELAR